MDPEILAILGQLGPQLTELTARFNVLSLASDQLGRQFDALLGPLAQWANALSPATVSSFDLAMRNLAATLGQAAVPVIGLLVTVVERFAGIISPAMQALAPILHELTATLSGVFLDSIRAIAEVFAGASPAIDAVVKLFSAIAGVVGPLVSAVVGTLAATLIPAITLVADVMSLLLVPFRLLVEVLSVVGAAVSTAGQVLALAFLPLTLVVEAINEVMTDLHEITRAVQIIFKSFYDAVSTFFRAWLKSLIDFGPVVDYIKKAFQEAAKQVILFSARLAAALGAIEYLKALRDNLAKEGAEQGALAAPQNVRIQDFAAISRDMIQAAFAAGPGGEQQKDAKDFLRELVPMIDDLIKNNKNQFTEFSNVIKTIDFHIGLIYELTSQTSPSILSGADAAVGIAGRGVRIIGKVFTGPG